MIVMSYEYKGNFAPVETIRRVIREFHERLTSDDYSLHGLAIPFDELEEDVIGPFVYSNDPNTLEREEPVLINCGKNTGGNGPEDSILFRDFE